MDESTVLGDLLELQLHRFEDEVKNIVDKAVKEMGIEKVCFFRHCKFNLSKSVQWYRWCELPVVTAAGARRD